MKSRLSKKKLKNNKLIELYINSIIRWTKAKIHFPRDYELYEESTLLMNKMQSFDYEQIYKIANKYHIKRKIAYNYSYDKVLNGLMDEMNNILIKIRNGHN